MSAGFSREQLERLRGLVAQRLGLDFGEEDFADLEAAANRRMAAESCAGAERYLDRLATLPRSAPELFALAEELTVTETFFFRGEDHLRVLREVVVPVARKNGRRALRIASLGCASGEEPYSIAMTLREAIPDIEGWDLTLLAFDASETMLKKARAANFSGWSLRVTPDEAKARYFSPAGQNFVLSRKISDMVRFEQLNLADGVAGAWRSLSFDAIFCRNVLMYFTPENMQKVVERVERALVPGGLLFLGHAETLRGMTHDFQLCHTHEAFYYQRRPPGLPSELLERGHASRELEANGAWNPAATRSWFDDILKASARVVELTVPRATGTRHGLAPGTAPAPSAGHAFADLTLALELMQKERYGEALAVLRGLPDDAGQNGDVLLLLGVLLTNGGAGDEAERVCRELLALDGLNSGAHYLLALCRERQGDLRAASEHDRTAIYLDPGFAMPHLHLGLLARRSGDRSVARRELGQALILLRREDTARLMLFGGGFSREGLLGLCRAELAGAGGQA